MIKNGKTVFSASVGVGQPQWPTPEGPVLHPRQADGLRRPRSTGRSRSSPARRRTRSPTGPAAGIVGIHGTSLPGLIPGKISHGCVRMKNADILKLDKLIEVGTPITIT